MRQSRWTSFRRVDESGRERTSPARAASAPMPAIAIPQRHTPAEVADPIPSPPSPEVPISITLEFDEDDLVDEEDMEVEKGKECVVCRDSRSDESYVSLCPVIYL